jgi:hypothetical protein
MTKIMERARQALAERGRETEEYRTRAAQELCERAIRVAAEQFGEYPDSAEVPDGAFYRGQVVYEDVAVGFREDGDSYGRNSRFFVMKTCPQCGLEMEKTVYSLADVAEQVDTEGPCMRCQVAASGAAPSYLSGLSAGEQEMAARLYRVLRETVCWQKDLNE